MSNFFGHNTFRSGLSFYGFPAGWLPTTIQSCQFHLNGNDPYTITRSGKLNQYVDNIIEKRHRRILTPVNATKKTSYNREAIFFDGSSYLTISNSKGLYNFLHDGSDYTGYIIFKVIKSNPDAQYFVFGTNDYTSSNYGFSMTYDDRSTSSRNDVLSISNSNGSVSYHFLVSSNNVLPTLQYNIVKFKRKQGRLSVWVNGALISSTLQTAIPDQNKNASTDLFIGANSGGTITFTGYIKQLALFNTSLEGLDESLMDNWMLQESTTFAPPRTVNVYGLSGQSNANGQALNTDLASAHPELNGVVGAKIWHTIGPGYSAATDDWEELELGVNQHVETPATYHGSQMRFGYEMNKLFNTWIIQFAIGGTALATVAGSDWNTSSTNELYDTLKRVWNDSLYEMEHKFKVTPIVRGFIWMQGEADSTGSVSGGSAYQGNLENLLKGWITYVNDTLGVSLALCRVTINRIRNQSPLFDSTQVGLVRTAQQYVGTNFITDFPTEGGKIKSIRWVDNDSYSLQSDQLHYDETGVNDMGNELKNYYDDYITET